MTVNSTSRELNTDELTAAAGGAGLRDRPEYSIIKDIYVNRGINSAMDLGLRYGFNGNEVMDMMKLIAEEIERDKNNSSSF